MTNNQTFFRADRLSSGIDELDIILEGGYQNPGIIVIVGPVGQEKLAFAFHFAFSRIKENEKIIYVALDIRPSEIEKKAKAFGFDLKNHTNKELVFIDAYSQIIGEREPERNDLIVPGPGALNELSLVLRETMEKNKGIKIKIVFHSLSTLTMYSPPDSVIKFLQVIEGRLKSANATSIWLVDEGMHDKKFLTALESMADEVFYLSSKEKGYEFKVPNIPIPLPIRIGIAGIEIQ